MKNKETAKIKEQILDKLEGRTINIEDLELENDFESSRNSVSNDYTLLCKDKKIRVFRDRIFDSEAGELGDDFEFAESEIELSDEDEEVIKDFIYNLD